MSRRMPKLEEINKWNGYVDSVKDVIVVEDTATEIGGDLEVDGVLTVNDIDGGTNGQVLTKVVDGASESVEWKSISGGTKLYKHTISLNSGQYRVVLVNTSSEAMTLLQLQSLGYPTILSTGSKYQSDNAICIYIGSDEAGTGVSVSYIVFGANVAVQDVISASFTSDTVVAL